MLGAFRMAILIAIVFLVVPGITFTIAQETTTIPQETCRIFTFRFTHQFFDDPKIDISTLVGLNKSTLERLKSLVTTDASCSVVGEVKLSEEVSYQSGIDEVFGIPFINQLIRFQVSAKESIKDSGEKVTQLGICLNSVQGKVGQDVANSVPLNASGVLFRGNITSVNVLQKSCCAKLFGFPDTVLRCCRPDFVNDGDECACQKGSFLNVNETRCDACPVDTYQPNSKSNECLQCPKGTTTYGETGADSLSSCLEACQPGEQYLENIQKCEPCPKDFYQPNEGQENCIACPSGEITRNTGSRRMEDCVQSCPDGSFYSFASEQCELCPRNSFQSKFGQFNCTACDADRVTVFEGSANANDCIKNCSQGMFFNQKTQQCEGCALHTYQPNFSATECIKCPNQGITVNTSSDMLEDCIKNCSAGSAYNFTTKQCEGCQLNFYQSKSGQTKCIACPEGKITISTSTISVDDCLKDCDPGFTYKPDEWDCEACPEDTYKPTKGQTPCIDCPNGTVTYKTEANTNITDCAEECEPGFYFNMTLWKCKKCPRNTTQKNRGQKMCDQCSSLWDDDRPITENEGSVHDTDCIRVCQAGEFFDKNLSICRKCEKNTYQPNAGTSACIQCNNTYLTFEEGSTSVKQCIKACPPGSYHFNRTDECRLCAMDEYQSESGKESCEKCGNRKLTFQNGSISKEDCFAVCKPGHFHNNATNSCDPCPRDEYQPLQRQFSCISCPKGTLTDPDKLRTSEKDCLWDCAKGFFHNATSNTCIECPIGTYKNKTGLISCNSCDFNLTTLTTATINRTQCINVCFEGNYFNLTLNKCVQCPVNSYQDHKTAIACLPCPNSRFTRTAGATQLQDCVVALPSESEDNLGLLVGVPIVIVVVVLSGCCLLMCLYRQWKEKRERVRRMSQMPLDPTRKASVAFFDERANSIASMANHHYKIHDSRLAPEVVRPNIRSAISIPDELEIPRDNLKFVNQVLGKGNFGRVEKAMLLKDGKETVVAVKMIKGGGTFSDEKELFDELEMLASLFSHPHPNIVNLIGGCTSNDGPLFVVVEYCGEGNLLKYLQKNQVSTKPKQEYVNIFPKASKPGIQYEWKLQKALEICHGMAHLAKFKIIHRDVAARNVLLDENWTAKISDFGMARDIYVKQIYRKDTEGFLPVRWMAIESLESFIYTTHSDVWSFGILLWEIVTDGRVPYNNILDHTQLLTYIKSGKIMKRPRNCPKDLYHIMEKCWATNARDRPSFETLSDALEVLYEDELHKDDALPQRIFRKFSSRRKRRKHDEEEGNLGGKTRAHKTISNNSGTKIEKIEEEHLNPKSEKPDRNEKSGDDEIKMKVLEPNNVNNIFENKGYERSGSATSENPREQPSNENSELGTISETPFGSQTEERQEASNDTIVDTEDRTLLDVDERPAPPLRRHEKEARAPIALEENDDISGIGEV